MNAHGLFCTAQKLLDLQMLLDPFEEQFNGPALFITLHNRQRRTAKPLVANTSGVGLSILAMVMQRNGFS